MLAGECAIASSQKQDTQPKLDYFLLLLLSDVPCVYSSDNLQINVREQHRRKSILLRFTDRLCMTRLTRLDDAWGEHLRACIRVVNWSLPLLCGILMGCV